MKKTGITVFLIVMITAVASGMAAFATGGTVFTEAQRLMTDAAQMIIAISTPAALVGIGTGALMKKFSMGNQQTISMGNKIMVGSLIGWAAINGTMLLLSTIQGYTGGAAPVPVAPPAP
jgi:hypothetical protein